MADFPSRFHRSLLGVLMLTVVVPGPRGESAPALSFSSGPDQVHLIELFTSEGCSSCPPADRWMSGLKSHADLWKRYVPVAFHVDYWDYIGWIDRFATPYYGLRQQRHAQSGGVSQVYTPGFVIDGQEWRNWFRNPSMNASSVAKPGTLTVEFIDHVRARVSFEPTGAQNAPLSVSVTLLGFDLASQVARGENTGKILKHDFVALGMIEVPLRHDDNAYRAEIAMPEPRQPADRYAIAAWVSSAESPVPLQALGGWLESPR